MESTPLHHKPITYGSDLADLIFLVAVVLHILPALAAPTSAVVAFVARKGNALHVRAGRVFVWSMATVAVTGIGIDLVRLSFAYTANHTKYAGYSQPSTIPARLGFLYAGLCVLYILYEAAPPRGLRRRQVEGSRWMMPGLLLATGAAFTALIAVRYNPWTGALWMIWIFAGLIVLTARGRASGVAQHRTGMSFLAAFSWWGALQGFIPGIVLAVGGTDGSTRPYVGDQPGPFTPLFFGFLSGFLPTFVLAAILIRRYRRRNEARLAQ